MRNIKGFLIACTKNPATGERECHVNPVNARGPYHLTQMANKCKYLYGDIGGTCEIALAYNVHTMEPIDM